MATLAQLRKRIDQAEARSGREPDVIYQIRLTGREPIPELALGQRLISLVGILPGQWVEVARG